MTFLTARIKEFLLFRGKETVKVILLIECNNLRLVDSIYDDKAAASFVTTGEEPSLNELQYLTTYTLTCKITTHSKTANQHTRIATQGLLMVCKAFHVIATTARQVIDTNTVVRYGQSADYL